MKLGNNMQQLEIYIYQIKDKAKQSITNIQKLQYVLGNSKEEHNYWFKKNKGVSTAKWRIFLLKDQRLLG